jgi:hypothetical protein
VRTTTTRLSPPCRFKQALSVSDGIGTTIDATPCVASDPPAYAGGLYGGFASDGLPCLAGIQALSVSDGIGVTIDATPCVASDPPAHAGGLYGGCASDGLPCLAGIQALSVSDGIPCFRSPGLRQGLYGRVQAEPRHATVPASSFTIPVLSPCDATSMPLPLSSVSHTLHKGVPFGIARC